MEEIEVKTAEEIEAEIKAQIEKKKKSIENQEIIAK